MALPPVDVIVPLVSAVSPVTVTVAEVVTSGNPGITIVKLTGVP